MYRTELELATNSRVNSVIGMQLPCREQGLQLIESIELRRYDQFDAKLVISQTYFPTDLLAWYWRKTASTAEKLAMQNTVAYIITEEQKNLNKYNSLFQMDPRDGLPHLHRGVHRGKRPVRSTGQARRSYVDRRKYCQLRPTTVASLSHWAATLAELSWRHVATIDGSGESFWVYGTNFQNKVPPFLEIPKFLYNIV